MDRIIIKNKSKAIGRKRMANIEGENLIKVFTYVIKLSAVLQHPEHDYMLANLDGLVDHPEYG